MSSKHSVLAGRDWSSSSTSYSVLANARRASLLQQHLLRQDGPDAAGKRTLSVRSLSPTSAGEYTCAAANSEGSGRSDPLKITVQCKYSSSGEEDRVPMRRTIAVPPHLFCMQILCHPKGVSRGRDQCHPITSFGLATLGLPSP